MSETLNEEKMKDKSNVTENSSDATSQQEVASSSNEVKTDNITKTESKAKSKEDNKVAKLSETELQTLDYNDFSTPARMLALGSVLAKSQLVPLKNAEDVVVALMTGKELGLPFVTSVSQIYPINGRPTLGVHIQKGILIKNGILINKTEDAVPIYQFAACDENGKPKTTKNKDGNSIPIIVSTGTADEQPPETLKREITKRTSYKFTRKIRMADNSYETMIVKSSFTLQEAIEAELTSKDVWQKYWRRMLDARAFTIGAREIADDLLLGMMSPSELSSNFYINEKGEEVHDAEVVS